MTEHHHDVDTRTIVAINYTPTPLNSELSLAKGWKLVTVAYGDIRAINDERLHVVLEPCHAAVFRCVRRTDGAAVLQTLPKRDAVIK